MDVKLKGRVTDVRQSEDRVFVTFLDAEQGGLVKLTMPPVNGLTIDALVNVDATVKPGIGQYGLYLQVLKLNKEGGDK